MHFILCIKTALFRRQREADRRRKSTATPGLPYSLMCLVMGAIMASGIAAFAEGTGDLNSDNARVRRTAIINASHSRSANLVDILHQGLADPSPIVVEESIKQIGRLRFVNDAPRLVTVHSEAEQRFGAYAERINSAVITSMGDLAGPLATQFLIERLRSDNGSEMGEQILLACRNTGDIALIPEIRLYADKMRSLIQKAQDKNLDPLTWSMKQRYVELAFEIENALATKGGK